MLLEKDLSFLSFGRVNDGSHGWRQFVEVKVCFHFEQARRILRTRVGPSDSRLPRSLCVPSDICKTNTSVRLAPGMYPRTNLRRESKYMFLEKESIGKVRE